MADLYLQQAEADEMLYFLAVDYKRILKSVDSALAYRRRALKLLQKEIKKNGGSKVRSDKDNLLIFTNKYFLPQKMRQTF